jgi:5-methylcytosine-specific restriction endonuclease McrA
MNKEEYNSLLQDWRWKKRRREILERDNYTCQECYADRSDDVILNVHHKYYIDGYMPWEYPDEALITLCEDCHRMEHEYNDIDVY